MTWTKSDDTYPDRLLELSDSAYRLHHAATVYSNRIGLDGVIPKARLTLIPVPPRTRRAAVIRELVGAGHWADDGDAYILTDFLRDQPSAEEVTLQRRWDVLRQQIRFAKGPDRAEKQASLQREADAARDALQAARNRRKATYSQANSLVNHSAPLRPVPDPSRPAPSEDEDGRRGVGLTAPLRGAAADLDEEPEFLPVVDSQKYPGKTLCFRCVQPIDDDDFETTIVRFGNIGRELHTACWLKRPTTSDQLPVDFNRPSPWADPANRCERCDKPFSPPHNAERVTIQSGNDNYQIVHPNCVGGAPIVHRETVAIGRESVV